MWVYVPKRQIVKMPHGFCTYNGLEDVLLQYTSS